MKSQLQQSVYLLLFSSLFTSLFAGCATYKPHPDLNLVSESQYFRLIQSQTRKTERYEGLMNTLNAAATLLTSEVSLAQVDQRARLMLTPLDLYQQEKQDTQNELQKNLKIHLSFFVPEQRFNNLQNSKSNWSIFLDTEQGRILPSHIHRLRWNFSEARRVYPHHTRWHVSYLLIFPVPTESATSRPLKLTVTGPISQTYFNWP